MITLAFDRRGASRVLKSKWFAALREVLGGRAWEVLTRLWLAKDELWRTSADDLAKLCDWPGDPRRFLSILFEFGVVRRCRGKVVMATSVSEDPPRTRRAITSTRPASIVDLRIAYGALSQRIRHIEAALRDHAEDEEVDGMRIMLAELRRQRDMVQKAQLGLIDNS